MSRKYQIEVSTCEILLNAMILIIFFYMGVGTHEFAHAFIANDLGYRAEITLGFNTITSIFYPNPAGVPQGELLMIGMSGGMAMVLFFAILSLSSDLKPVLLWIPPTIAFAIIEGIWTIIPLPQLFGLLWLFSTLTQGILATQIIMTGWVLVRVEGGQKIPDSFLYLNLLKLREI